MSGPSSAAPAKVPERLSEAGWTNGLLTGVPGKGNSANFAFWAFSEVRYPQATPKQHQR